MRCKSALTRLDAGRTGELPAEEAVRLEQHLANCPSCDESRRDLEGLAAIARKLKGFRGVLAASHDGFDSIDSHGFRIFVVFNDRGVREITGRYREVDEFLAAWHQRHPGLPIEMRVLPQNIRRAIETVLAGGDPGAFSVDLSGLTPFETRVLETIRRIPRGEVRPYRWVAEAVGRPKAVRAVGNVMARNPIPLLLPCHRVVPNGGGLGNYGWGPAMKRRLLDAEGVPVEELDRLARAGTRFLGSRTTKIFCFPTCRDARRIREANREAFRDEEAAERAGYRPCLRCQPLGPRRPRVSESRSKRA